MNIAFWGFGRVVWALVGWGWRLGFLCACAFGIGCGGFVLVLDYCVLVVVVD